MESESNNIFSCLRDCRIFCSLSSKYVEVFEAPCPKLKAWLNICFPGLNGREVTVPVPWGEIRGREWGSEDGVPWIGNSFLDRKDGDDDIHRV